MGGPLCADANGTMKRKCCEARYALGGRSEHSDTVSRRQALDSPCFYNHVGGLTVKFSPMHIVVLLVLVLLIFGAGKLPEIASSIGQSMKVFKREVKELREDDAAPAAGQQQAPAQIAQPQEGTYYTQPTQPGQAAPAANPEGTQQA